MASNTIKGLTVEIGGDTTKLGKALDSVNKQSRGLSAELSDINRLLKMDPKNTDLLAQKQKVLGKQIENTKEKLKTLKEAEKQVQEQFKRGKVSEEQVRALQREIIGTTQALERQEKQAKETADAMKGIGDSSDKVTEASGGMGKKLGGIAAKGLGAVAAAATAAIGALVGCAEATREYRTDMGKLDTAFTTAGHSSEVATKTYQTLQGVLGDSAQAVEAANHLAQLTESEEDLAKWTDIATGVYATFGSSLPIENITEAANETSKTGKITGGLADALNWAGVSEDEFQAKLDACTTTQERQALITETLNGLYGEAAEKYRETNAEVIRANEANEAWTASMAEAGAAVEPVLTDVKLLGASLLTDFLPGITSVTEAFRGLLNGTDGAADQLGAALSGLLTQLLDKVSELAPTVVQVAMSLITTLVTTLLGMLPQLTTTVVQLVSVILESLSTALPQIVTAITALIPQLVQALVDGIPVLIDGALQLLLAIVQAVPLLIEQLLPQIPVIIDALTQNLPQIITTIVQALVRALPQIVQGAVTLLMGIIQALPTIIQALVVNLPRLITTIQSTLIQNLPVIIQAAVQLFMGIVKAIPQIISELVRQMPSIIKAIVQGLGEGVKSVTKIGGDLIRGLWQGISDMAGWIKKKIQGFGEGVLNNLKDFFGIKSPSRKMAWVGEMLDEGLAKGIEDAADAPVDAMDDLAAGLLKQGTELDGLNIDRNINATFGASASRAGAVDSGLMAKLDSILSAIEAGQVIALDGKTLVGSTVTDYDNKLGQRRALAARGAI